MLSFLMQVGSGNLVDSAAQQEIFNALAQRSWCNAAQSQPDTSHPWPLWHCGGTEFIRRGARWHLLRAPLVREEQNASDAAFLTTLHHALQDAATETAVQHLVRALQKREKAEAWIAWSEHFQTALVFRDPLGRVPLYLYHAGNNVLVSNTRRALEPWVRHEPIASTETLASLLVSGSPPTSKDALFRNLSRVEPGTYAVLHIGHAIQRTRWWHWEQPPLEQNFDLRDAAAVYRELMQRSLHATLRAPLLGVELSGGMDSTSVLAAARRVRPDLPVHAINYALDDEDMDRVLSRDLCAAWRLNYQGIDPSVPPSTIPLEPFTPASALHTLRALGALGSPVDALSGHGGDNLFRVQRTDVDQIQRDLSPLQWGRLLRAHQKIHGQLPPFFLRERMGRKNTDHPLSVYLLPWFSKELSEAMRELMSARFRGEQNATSSIENLTYHPLWSGILEMSDTGMHGAQIQYHFPFFDLDVMRFIASIPAIPWKHDKYFARHAWQDILPHSITQRPKIVHQPLSLAHNYPPTLLKHAQQIHWLNADALAQWFQNDKKFPSWTYGSAHATLDLLQWDLHQNTSRLTNPVKAAT